MRGNAGRADAAFVAELAASLGLPFDLGHWTPDRPGHFESDARRARYEWLTEIARARGASIVAMGHTRDDQAETILHRILRGTGPHGLAGIPVHRVIASEPTINLIRPLLAVSRRDIRAYLDELGQPYREDETNADLTRTRARIRHDLLPRLAADYNPNVVLALARLGRLAATSQRAIAADVHRLAFAAVVTRAPECVVLKQGIMRSVPAFVRAEVLRRIWRRAGWPEAGMSARRWQRLAGLVQEQQIARTEIGAGVAVSTDGSFLVLRRAPRAGVESPPGSPAAAAEFDPSGVAVVPWAGGRVVASSDPEGPREESVDLDRLALPLLVRAPAAGDRFEPLGMGGRTMPLADFFRGRRVPRTQRVCTPLVCDQSGIVWVVGHRIAERVKVTEHTRRAIGLRWEATT
jgi:tRNA(Ile)-lysidine synthase